jgi:hypothetical protein
MTGWTKPKGGAVYAGVSERTFRPWLKKGLRHVRLETGTILIRYKWIDEFLENFEVQGDEVSRIVNEIQKEMDIK